VTGAVVSLIPELVIAQVIDAPLVGQNLDEVSLVGLEVLVLGLGLELLGLELLPPELVELGGSRHQRHTQYYKKALHVERERER